MSDHETLESLRGILDEWYEKMPGNTRIQFVPYSKYTGEVLLKEDDQPRLVMEELAYEVEDACRALTFWECLK